MPIKVTCACGKVTNVPDAYAGRTGKCPGCGNPVKVPGALVAMASAAAPQATQAPVAAAVKVAPASNPFAAGAAPIAPAESRYIPAPMSSASAQMIEGNSTAAVAVATDNASAEEHPAISYSAASEAATARDGHETDIEASAVTSVGPATQSIHVSSEIPKPLEQPNRPTVYVAISTDGAQVFTEFDASPVLDKFVETFAESLKDQFDVQIGLPRPDGAAAVVLVHLVRIHQGKRGWRYLLPVLANFVGAATCFAIDGQIQLPGREPVPFEFKHGCWLGVLGGSRGVLKSDAKKLAEKLAVRFRKIR